MDGERDGDEEMGEGVDVRMVIVKRTGEIVPFDPAKIEEAVKKAILVSGE